MPGENRRQAYVRATGDVLFTKDFNPSLEALMHDPMATIGERTLAWLKWSAWGRFSLYAVNQDGSPAYQIDCATYLDIDPRAISNAIKYYERLGYVKCEA